MRLAHGLTVIAVLSALAGTAAAKELPPAPQTDLPVEEEKESLWELAGDALGSAAGAAANGVSSASRSTGRTFGAVGEGLGAFFAAVGHGVAVGATAMGHGFAVAAQAMGHGFVSAAKALGHGFALAAVAVGEGIAALASSLAAGIAAAFGALGRGIAAARPEAMHPALYYPAVSAGSAGASAGLWFGLRRLLRLLPFAGFPLFSRIEKGDLLDHPTRAHIYETIKANPGIHISEIARVTGAGWGTTIHHLRKLRASRLVCIRDVNHQKCFFVNGGAFSPAEMASLSELKNEKALRIALHLRDHPGASVTELAAAVGISPSLVSFHANKLVKAGLLERRREGKAVRLAPTEHARQRILGDEALLASLPHGHAVPVPAAASSDALQAAPAAVAG